MGSRLTKLEEAKLKKPNPHVEAPISFFGELCDCGTRIEDAINSGQLEKGESKLPIKKTYGGGTTASKASNPVNASAIIPQQTLAYPSFTKKAR
ncbi:hypothetical protein SO802_005972 [Lithocarpus litseifolius]|uniref:Uncharacterized protein n=1 Tax=Lithocarpus litseifolius TaxID=425828 RepID=A0AAW2DL56_9ROSI